MKSFAQRSKVNPSQHFDKSEYETISENVSEVEFAEEDLFLGE